MPKRNIHTRIAGAQLFTLPTILASLIHYAEQKHWDYEKWFEDSGLNIKQIQQTNNVVYFNQMCEVIRKVISTQQQPDLGLKIGCSEGLISMGILGFVMQSCKTFGDALQIALRYHRISGSVLNIEFSLHGDICLLQATEYSQLFDLTAFFYDELFSTIITCLNSILGDHKDIIDLELNYFPSDYLEEYKHMFDFPVRFNCDKNIIRFKSSMLQRCLKNYSPTNYSTAVQICEQTLKEIDKLKQANYAYLLEYLIEKYLPARFEMQQAAEYLQISERHLRRQLLLEGLSFQKIRQNVLERKAKQMLEQNVVISQIGRQLGFSELREFRRAFKRWTGQAPSIYKQQKVFI